MALPSLVVHDTIRMLVTDRLVRKIADRYEPDKRHAGSPEKHAEALAELTGDVLEMLPPRESPETIGIILDRAWKSLRQSYTYPGWPKTPTVLGHVRQAVDDWRAKADRPAGPSLPQRPNLPQPETCRRKAEHFQQQGAEVLADYWTKVGADSAIAWNAWWAAGGGEIDAKALKGSENGGAA